MFYMKNRFENVYDKKMKFMEICFYIFVKLEI